MQQQNLGTFENSLRERIKGDVHYDQVSRGLYSTDASIYQIMPAAVVLPKDQIDVCAAVKIAGEHNVPITSRGAGTSLNGQAIGAGLILDFSKYMNKILEVNTDQRWVRVQPGLVIDELNAALAEHSLMFAPDPATGSRATVGGAAGNNSSGPRSIINGITVDHVLEIKALLADGTVVEFGEVTAEQYEHMCKADNQREAQIYGRFKKIIDANRAEIEKNYPRLMRRVQGYNLDAFTNSKAWNLSKLLVGSEGTLGIFLELKLKLVPAPKAKSLCLVHYATLNESLVTVTAILAHKPSAVEIMDREILTMARKNPSLSSLTGFIDGDPAAILVVEFFGDSAEDAGRKAEQLAAELQQEKIGYAQPVLADPAEQAKVWKVRKGSLGLMQRITGNKKPTPIIEDTCVPLEVLPQYIDEIMEFCRQRGISISMYAHASVGTIHVRPLLNLKEQKDIDLIETLTDFVFALVKKYGGSLSSEHGDGRIRSPYLEKFFGKQVYEAFGQVKKLFDPAGVLNPGIIVEPGPVIQSLRYGTDYKMPTEPTLYHYREDGSFAGAVEMCVGIGACRQNLDAVMCPSYRLTRDEEHSTRGRANALRLAMTGQLGPDAMTSERLAEVLELCLSCKSCKSECPSNVDITRLKSEVMQKYHDTHWTPLREHFVRNSALLASILAGPWAPLVNFVQRNRLFRKALEIFVGFDSRRIAPAYDSRRLHGWFKKRPKPANAPNGPVVLFDDTYIKYHVVDIGVSAVELLESCGYEVVLAKAGCCQRPKISHGFIREAKKKGEKTLRKLDEHIRRGLKVVVCEPSCCSALIDDLCDLIDDVELAGRIKQNVMMIDEFLAGEVKAGRVDCQFTSPYEKIVIHGHCHQKALFGTTAMTWLLNKVPGISVRELDTGCCGMAGSFGFEKEHYDLSMQIGEQRLFPGIRSREDGAAVVACGFSCRDQIKDGTGVKPLHWVQTIHGRHT